jgi:hypothetical protein
MEESLLTPPVRFIVVRGVVGDSVLTTPTDIKAEARSLLFEVFRAGIRTQHHHRRHRDSAGRLGVAPAPSVLLYGSRSLRSPGCYLTPRAGHYNSGKCFIVNFSYSPSVEGVGS